MAKHSSSSSGRLALQKRRWLFPLLVGLSVTTALAFILRASFDSPCDHRSRFPAVPDNKRFPSPLPTQTPPNPLTFMKSKRVLLVSHDLSLSAFVGLQARNHQKQMRSYTVWSIRCCTEEYRSCLQKTAVAGKWLDAVLKENVTHVLPKVLWWIHEIRGHYFKMEFVKHLPLVDGAMIDSHVTADYWKNRTQVRLKIRMPETYVVHFGNSKELMEVAEDKVAKRVLREHIRESLGVRNEDILFALINSVSHGKGQDLFLCAFYDSLLLIQEQKMKVPSLHAVIVGSDMTAQTKFELELRNFVALKKIQNRVHFNSQARGECFGRITIEAMGFQLPVLGTSAGGTTEIVVNERTGLLHPVGKAGVTPLAKNIAKLAIHVERRLTMGRRGHGRVKEMFLECHMAHRIAAVLKEVLQSKTKNHNLS
ncbi:unnamed protein product [Camellia sinensis]